MALEPERRPWAPWWRRCPMPRSGIGTPPNEQSVSPPSPTPHGGAAPHVGGRGIPLRAGRHGHPAEFPHRPAWVLDLRRFPSRPPVVEGQAATAARAGGPVTCDDRGRILLPIGMRSVTRHQLAPASCAGHALDKPGDHDPARRASTAADPSSSSNANTTSEPAEAPAAVAQVVEADFAGLGRQPSRPAVAAGPIACDSRGRVLRRSPARLALQARSGPRKAGRTSLPQLK